MSTRIQVRRGLAATWTSVDPVLASGEHGFETDTGQFKIGDGSTVWSSLAYQGGGGGGTPSGTVAALDGTSAAGASLLYSRGDHKHSDANRPTTGEKAALVGTSGTPGSGNKFVTDADPRLASAEMAILFAWILG